MARQNLTPINDQLADIIVRADAPWIETKPGQAWMKILWTGPETGRWAALYRWKKGYTAASHKHLSDAHTYILKGRLKVRDGILEAGDYDYEPNGVLHGATEALEDTEYLFSVPVPSSSSTRTGSRTITPGKNASACARQRSRRADCCAFVRSSVGGRRPQKSQQMRRQRRV